MPENTYGARRVASSRGVGRVVVLLCLMIWVDLVGIVCWSVCRALFLFGGTIFCETVGTSGVSCANVGASSCYSVSLERTVSPQVVSLDLIDSSSKHFY